LVSSKEKTSLPNISKEPAGKNGKIWVKGPTSSKPSPVYTGSKMIGIAQMHKSNSIPVFNHEEIVDISKMRR
jgi:hypothetical protein